MRARTRREQHRRSSLYQADFQPAFGWALCQVSTGADVPAALAVLFRKAVATAHLTT